MTITQQLTLLAVLLLTSKGAAGVTGSGFIVLAATLSAVGGVPVAGLALILGIDRFMSEARALTNLVGNGVATVVIGKWTGDLDATKLHQRLTNETTNDAEEPEAVLDEGYPQRPKKRQAEMLKAELLEIIANGENSGVEFKRDDIRPEQLAREIVALANFQGGRIILGIEDDGTISGLQQKNTQEWVLNVFRDKVFPQIIPFYEELKLDNQHRVAVITIAPGVSKPYMLKHNNREEVYIRMGDRSELASREQQLRLFESGGLLHLEVLPVAGTALATLDLQRLYYYLSDVIRDTEVPQSDSQWQERLVGLGLMAPDGWGNTVCSIAGLLCLASIPGAIYANQVCASWRLLESIRSIKHR